MDLQHVTMKCAHKYSVSIDITEKIKIKIKLKIKKLDSFYIFLLLIHNIGHLLLPTSKAIDENR